MKAYSIIIAVALTSLIHCQSVNNKSQLSAFQSADDIEEIEVTLISNPKACSPCAAFEPKYEELMAQYASHPKVKLLSHKKEVDFYKKDANGKETTEYTEEWIKFRKKHNITIGVPILRVKVKNKDGENIGERSLDSENKTLDYKEFIKEFVVDADVNKAFVNQYIQNSIAGKTLAMNTPRNLTKNTPVAASPTVKDDFLFIGSHQWEIIKDENGLPIQLKEGSYIFDPSITKATTLNDGSQIQAKKSDSGFIFEHCVFGACRPIDFNPKEYTLFPDLTKKHATVIENKVFSEVKVESKVCGETCSFEKEMAKIEDIIAGKYQGLSYDKVKEALEEALIELKKTNSDFKDVAIPDAK